jgi:hypothetical protein
MVIFIVYYFEPYLNEKSKAFIDDNYILPFSSRPLMYCGIYVCHMY